MMGAAINMDDGISRSAGVLCNLLGVELIVREDRDWIGSSDVKHSI